MLLNCGVGEDSWEFLGLQGDPTSPFWRRSALNIHWKDWCWGWNSNTLATWCKELTHWRRPWCWERLKAGGEGDNRGWDGWTASATQWTGVWVNSRSWWWTGRPGVLCFLGSQRVRHDWETELNWTEVTMKELLLFNCSVMSESLQPRGLQHSRLPCPSPLLELAQTHIHWNDNAIQPSHPLLPPSPPALNLSQHLGYFQWVSSLHQMANILELQLQHQSFQRIFRVDFL